MSSPHEWPILELYEYYDGPRLFLTRSPVGTLYIVFWTDTDNDSRTWDEWLYVPLSEERLAEVRAGALPIRAVIDRCEEDYALRVTTHADGTFEVRPVSVVHLEEEDKPDPEATILTTTPWPLPTSRQLASPEGYAQTSGRDVLDVSLEPAAPDGTRVDADHVGTFILRLQSLFRSIAYPWHTRGPLSQGRLLHTGLQAEAVFQSSFGLRLVSKDTAMLASPLEAIVPAFVDLLNMVSDDPSEEKLVSGLKPYPPSVRAKYRLLLQSLVDAQTSLSTVWASAHHESLRVHVPIKSINSAVSLLETVEDIFVETKTMQGVLHLVDIDRGRFRLEPHGGGSISGSINPDVMEAIRVWSLGKETEVQATISEHLDVDQFTGAEKPKFVLMSIEWPR